MSGNRIRVLHEVSMERARQDEKWGEQNHDDFTWLAILTEELGEVAEGALVQVYEGSGTPHDVRAELIQVAAVAVSWIECLDRCTERVDDEAS